jgi:hypothetical protein
MRIGLILLGLGFCLTGCGEDGPPIETGTGTILKYPSDQAELAKSDAAAQCKFYGKTATLKDPQKQGDQQVIVYACE